MQKLEPIKIYSLLIQSQVKLSNLGQPNSLNYFQECFSITGDMKWDAMMIRQTIRVTRPEAYQEHVQKFTGQIGLIPPFPGT